MQEISDMFKTVDMLIKSCDVDYGLIRKETIDENLFNDYDKQRVVNSFLFNYTKIQDRIGAKIFKKVLFELKEINDFSLPMIDVLNILEKLNIIDNAQDWDRLREIRNAISHEYPLEAGERIDNIKNALEGYVLLKKFFNNIKQYCKNKGLI